MVFLISIYIFIKWEKIKEIPATFPGGSTGDPLQRNFVNISPTSPLLVIFGFPPINHRFARLPCDFISHWILRKLREDMTKQWIVGRWISQ